MAKRWEQRIQEGALSAERTPSKPPAETNVVVRDATTGRWVEKTTPASERKST